MVTLFQEILPQIPPFDFLTPKERQWLEERSQPARYEDGHTILAPEDQEYDSLYFLAQGWIAAHYRGESSRRAAPSYFGELAIIFDQPRNAQVVAEGPVSCFVATGADIRLLITQNPAFRQAFASVLRNKQRIFYGYETFTNLLLTRAAEGQLHIHDLLAAYRGLKSVLHPGSWQTATEIDFAALGYVIPRLPENLTSLLSLDLVEDLPEMVRQVQTVLQCPTQRAKKRKFFTVMPGKSVVLLRERLTDTVDLITKLCAYVVETGKVRRRLENSPTAGDLARLAVNGSSLAEAQAVLAGLPFSAAEREHLQRLFGGELHRRLYEMLVQGDDLLVHFQAPDYRYTETTWEAWLAQIRAALASFLSPVDFETLEVHIISSNTHSVVNCLSSWAQDQAETVLRWAQNEGLEFFATLPPSDLLYPALNQWLKTQPELRASRKAADLAHGIRLVEDKSMAGIGVSLIDANRLGANLDPTIGNPQLASRTLIVNIDYAYGQQAKLIIRNLILLFGRRIRSISVFGKSGAIVGQRGDLLLPDELILQTSNELYPIPNPDLEPTDFAAAGCARTVHQGTLLTVLGTIMQNNEMLRYYRLFWNVIGMEMEASFYLREILRSRSLGLLPEDVRLRFAYYASDTPLDPDTTLASSLSAAEGIPPVYAITRAVLRRILSPARAAARAAG